MVLDRRILVTSVATIGVLLFLMAILASPVWAQAELTVDKTGPDTVEKGQEITYEIEVKSTKGTARKVELEDPLPSGTTFVSASVTGDGTCSDGNSGTVTCTLGKIDKGDTKNVTLAVSVGDGTQDIITNTATATSDNAGEDSDTATTTLGSNNSDTNTNSDASGGGVKLTCEQLIKLVQDSSADTSQYSVEVSQRCEGSANVIPGTVPNGTLADTGGIPLIPGALALGGVLIGGGLLLRASLRRER